MLLDDVVFSYPCHTSTDERVVTNFPRLTRFHTATLFSLTLQELLTNRNQHSVNANDVTELATSATEYISVQPRDKAPIADDHRLNGYSTPRSGSTTR
ncbi:hypothetical protein [Mycobacterium leprae]|uniref:hypothetical protein n=1 Tax=Mycobacterium leprae TaxID=1769 RepID=UPI0002F0838C|nr:hypothetical protein [Mycobacterium leprae]